MAVVATTNVTGFTAPIGLEDATSGWPDDKLSKRSKASEGCNKVSNKKHGKLLATDTLPYHQSAFPSSQVL